MARRKKSYSDDDGRVIAPMNVEGMPWYRKPSDASQREQLSGQQTRHALFAAVLAGLVVAVAVSAAMILFILFCVKVWLK